MSGATPRTTGDKYGDGSKITKETALVSIFTHEGFHDTDQVTINALKTRQENGTDPYPVESAAFWQNVKVLKEVKEK